MTGHIRQRGVATWEVRYALGTDPATGRRRTATATVKGSRKDAERELRRLLRQVDTGEAVAPNRITVGQWFDKWLEIVRGEVSPATHARYTQMVGNYLRPAWGGLRLAQFTPAHIQDKYAEWSLGGRRDGRPGPLAPSTRRLIHRVLTVALNRALDLELIGRNPAMVLRRRLPKIERKDVAILSPEQCRLLLNEVELSAHYWPVLLALTSGARRGEILALRWRNVDFERGAVTIAESVSPELRFGPTKSGKPRIVTLPRYVLDELRQRRIEQVEQLLLLGVRQTADDFICAWEDGSIIRPYQLSQFCDRLFDRLGLPGRFHVLRHTHASQLLLAGVHPKVAQERLGHATISLTLDIYSHLIEQQHDDAAERIGDVLRDGR